MLPLIHVVIPVFNGWEQTRRCLDALRNCGYAALRILVVDHGSTDETPVALSRDYAEIVRIEGDESMWWSAATNLGVRAALNEGATLVMLLNNDCYLQAGAIESMVSHLRSKPRMIIAPMQTDLSGKRIQSAGIRYCLLLGYLSIEDRSPIPTSGLKRVSLIAGGRGVLIPRAVFESVGLMDEVNLPHYAADHDFYLRCREQGIELYIDASAVIKVDGTRTSVASRLETLSFRSFLATLRDRRSHRNLHDLAAFFRKNYPVRGLYGIGVALNVTRYFAAYALRRTLHRLHHALATRKAKQ